ncbi:hypothetical protein A1D30_21880 [Acidovorax sp. GW101-3H11]|uniref:hypothetical protein n=1 Tax=Acidovorax sp. GW101-3H11 TaxID=1813946 RepID=UPI0007C12C76|nr:hypothetical protein [Acidovorax sp. GW101-3H11]KZT13763.1 hypothetical protein A1D30_21880 [Acidovorax sp. GW101-3H11]
MAARFWRLSGFMLGGNDLELAEIALLNGTTRLDGAATLTASHAPITGTLAALKDNDVGSSCRFAAQAVASAGFFLHWDMGSDVEVDGLRLAAGASEQRWPQSLSLAYWNDAQGWMFVAEGTGLLFPGTNAWAADAVAGLIPTTWNPADKGPGVTLSDGDLYASSSFYYYAVRSVHGVSARKCYWEVSELTGYSMPGIATAAAPVEVLTAEGAYPGANAHGWGYYSYSTGVIYHGGVEVLTGLPTIGSFTVLSFVLDMDLGTLRLWFDGVDAGVVASGIVGPIYAFFGSGASAIATCRANFGATPFVYVPPAGFQAGFGPTRLLFPVQGAQQVRPSRIAAGLAVSAPVPVFSTEGTARAQMARDVEFGGQARIWGTTKIKGTPNVPTKARVVLQHQRSKLLVRETWSDPVTGAFEFRGIDANQQFLTLAEDLAGNFRPVAASKLVPEVLA